MKPKNFIKNYLTGFFIGLILFTVVGVSAATYFPSNQTTYNNGTTGMNATNVQTAIDELYNTCFPPTLGDQILEKTDLEKDPYECRYFFTGANPNNYITFNGENAGWRIISVECDGTIKIMRNESIGNMVYDSYNGYWDYPASLNTYLNETYYNNLNQISKSQIEIFEWNIGRISNVINNDLQSQIKNENSSKYSANIGLITPSEYLRTNSNILQCGTMQLDNSNYNICRNTNWILNNSNFWTITPSSADSESVYLVTGEPSSNNLNLSNKNRQRAVIPTLYLSANLVLSGNGSQSNPYTIK